MLQTESFRSLKLLNEGIIIEINKLIIKYLKN
jgi:hypothetical protein